MTRDPHIEVTPWSKTPSKAYEPVDVEIVAILDGQYVMMLLSKRNGFRMAINLTAAGVEQLHKDLSDIRRRFKAYGKESI